MVSQKQVGDAQDAAPPAEQCWEWKGAETKRGEHPWGWSSRGAEPPPGDRATPREQNVPQRGSSAPQDGDGDGEDGSLPCQPLVDECGSSPALHHLEVVPRVPSVSHPGRCLQETPGRCLREAGSCLSPSRDSHKARRLQRVSHPALQWLNQQ